MGGRVFDEKNGSDQRSAKGLKLEPLEGDFLRRQYEDIIPGYYMNKTHWNSIKADGNVPDDLLRDLLDKSCQIVLGNLSRKKQREIHQAVKTATPGLEGMAVPPDRIVEAADRD